MPGQSFKCIQYIVSFHKGHFAVDLGKFRLTIGSQVFVPETLDNLEILIKARHHQQLLEGLGGLGQGIKFTGIHAGRHHKIPGPFGGGFDQYRGFYLQESLLA